MTIGWVRNVRCYPLGRVSVSLRHLDRDCFVAPLLAMTTLDFRHCKRRDAISAVVAALLGNDAGCRQSGLVGRKSGAHSAIPPAEAEIYPDVRVAVPYPEHHPGLRRD